MTTPPRAGGTVREHKSGRARNHRRPGVFASRSAALWRGVVQEAAGRRPDKPSVSAARSEPEVYDAVHLGRNSPRKEAVQPATLSSHG